MTSLYPIPLTSKSERTTQEPRQGRLSCTGNPISTLSSWRFPPSCCPNPALSCSLCQEALPPGHTSRDFENCFFRIVSPSAIHLFESRKEVFKGQTVLQENLIITARRCKGSESGGGGEVLISHSRGAADIADSQRFLAGMDSVLDLASKNKELSIPLCESDLDLIRVIRSWPNSLHTLGLEISTGPVVPFRATQFLSDSKDESLHCSTVVDAKRSPHEDGLACKRDK